MSAYRLDRVLRPTTVALIGASADPSSFGQVLTAQAIQALSPERLYLVNPKYDELYGRVCLRQVEALPDELDLAVLLTPWSRARQVLDELADKRCAGAVILGVAGDGLWRWIPRQLDTRWLGRWVQRTGLRVIGPASQGLSLPAQGVHLSLDPVMSGAGGIAFVSAHGAIAGLVSRWCSERGIGMSAVLSLGDQLDVDLADALDHLAVDAQTKAVLVYIDHWRRPRKLLSAARALAQRKPVVALWGPRADERHRHRSGAFDAAVDHAALERAGVLVVEDLEQLCAAANVDLPAWPHHGTRFAICANAPDLLQIATAAVERRGASLADLAPATTRALRAKLPTRSAARNPVELFRDADAGRFRTAVELLRRDPGVDVVLVCHHRTHFAAPEAIAEALPEPLADGPVVLAALVGADRTSQAILHRRGIACFDTPEAAVAAYVLNRHYYRQRQALSRTPPPLLEHDLPDPLVREELRAELTPTDPAAALAALLRAIGSDWQVRPGLPPVSFCRLGIATHAELGPYAFVASPGCVAVEPLPLDRLRAQELIDRGCPPPALDPDLRAQLHAALLRWSRWLLELPEIAAVTFADPVRAAGGEIRIHGWLEFSDQPVPPCFAPIPREPREWIHTREGERLLLRPIQAEDEPRLQEGFTRLTPEEVRMRFLYPLKALTHELAARLTQLDYDREIALVLSDEHPPGQAQLYGVVRASLNRTTRSAEFAIVLPRALSGQGLGTLLMQRIMALARSAGMVQIWGDVLAENAAMLALARKLGFGTLSVPGQPGLLRIIRPLL